MIIHSGIHDYELTLEGGLDFVSVLLSDPAAFYVVDANVYWLYPQLFAALNLERTFLLQAVEEEKTLETALSICERMTKLPQKRNARLISFGGGITQDITGFAANVLYRGIHWTFVPTTLLAACDSCIGGKTSLNYKGYKNLLGTFYPPERIYVCPAFFGTLSEGDFLSGLGEVVKFNILRGESGVEDMERDLSALCARDPETVGRYTEQSLLFKKEYIEQDEYDTGVRVHLNFAHTFGHALETVSGFAIPHGTAVAMGTIVANHISLMRGLLTPADAERMEQILLRIIPRQSIPKSNDTEALAAAIRNDKKQVDQGVSAVLLSGDGTLTLVRDVTKEELATGYEHLASFGA